MSQKKKKAKAETINSGYTKLNLSLAASVFFIAISSIFPLYFSRTGYMTITQDKTIFFLFLTFFSAGAIIIALFITADRKRPFYYISRNLLNERPITIAEWSLLAFLLLTFASAIASPWQDFVWNGFTFDNRQGRWEGFWAFLGYCLTFFIIARFYKPDRKHFIVFACSAILLSLYGIMQYINFDILERTGYLLVIAPQPGPVTMPFRTTLGNINVVSAYCSLVIVLFAALFAGENSKWNLFYLAASAFAFAMLTITRGYAGQVGVLGAMVLLIPYWVSDRKRLGRILIVLSSWSAVFAINRIYFLLALRLPEINQPFSPNDRIFLQQLSPSFPVLFVVIALVLLAAGLCLLLVFEKQKWQWQWPERPMKIAGLVMLGVMIVGGLLFVEIEGARRADQPGNIIWQAREMLRGRLDDDFGSARGWVWKNGFSVIRNNPWLGTGPDTFFFALGGTQMISLSDVIQSGVPRQMNALDGLHVDAIQSVHMFFDKAHNMFLQIAVCQGIPALLAFLIFLGALFIPAIKKAFNQPVLLAFAAGSLSYLIQSFFQIDTPIDRPLIYLALGVMAAELCRKKDQKADVSGSKETV